MSEKMEWYKKGYDMAMRTNKSGCVCKFDENDNIVSICDAHREYFEERFKPLRWRTGPVPETDKWEEFLVCSPLSATGYGYSIRKGNLIDAGEKYIPLSDILGLVEG